MPIPDQGKLPKDVNLVRASPGSGNRGHRIQQKEAALEASLLAEIDPAPTTWLLRSYKSGWDKSGAH